MCLRPEHNLQNAWSERSAQSRLVCQRTRQEERRQEEERLVRLVNYAWETGRIGSHVERKWMEIAGTGVEIQGNAWKCLRNYHKEWQTLCDDIVYANDIEPAVGNSEHEVLAEIHQCGGRGNFANSKSTSSASNGAVSCSEVSGIACSKLRKCRNPGEIRV